jgi:hypothetical protein
VCTGAEEVGASRCRKVEYGTSSKSWKKKTIFKQSMGIRGLDKERQVFVFFVLEARVAIMFQENSRGAT